MTPIISRLTTITLTPFSIGLLSRKKRGRTSFMAFITASNPPPLQTRSPRARARVIGIPRGRWRENIYFSLGKKTPPRFPPKGGGAKLICKLVSIPSSSSRTLFPGAGGQTDTPMFYIRLEMVINGGKLWSLFFLARIRSIKQRGGGRPPFNTLR